MHSCERSFAAARSFTQPRLPENLKLPQIVATSGKCSQVCTCGTNLRVNFLRVSALRCRCSARVDTAQSLELQERAVWSFPRPLCNILCAGAVACRVASTDDSEAGCMQVDQLLKGHALLSECAVEALLGVHLSPEIGHCNTRVARVSYDLQERWHKALQCLAALLITWRWPARVLRYGGARAGDGLD